MPATDEYLQLFDKTIQRDRDQGFSKPNGHTIKEATAYAVAALAASLNTLAKKETEAR